MASAQDEQQIATRYVTALFDLAQAQSKQDVVASELQYLATLMVESADFRNLCNSPAISVANKAEAVAALCKQAKASDLTAQFVGVLAQNQRLAVLPQIAEQFQLALRNSRNEVVAIVESASPLDAAVEKELVQNLSQYTGKKVILQQVQKPEVLGGLRVRIGGMLIDASLAGKLDRLARTLRSAA